MRPTHLLHLKPFQLLMLSLFKEIYILSLNYFVFLHVPLEYLGGVFLLVGWLFMFHLAGQEIIPFRLCSKTFGNSEMGRCSPSVFDHGTFLDANHLRGRTSSAPNADAGSTSTQVAARRACRLQPCQSLSAASFKLRLDISGQEGCPCESREGMNLKRRRGAYCLPTAVLRRLPLQRYLLPARHCFEGAHHSVILLVPAVASRQSTARKREMAGSIKGELLKTE